MLRFTPPPRNILHPMSLDFVSLFACGYSPSPFPIRPCPHLLECPLVGPCFFPSLNFVTPPGMACTRSSPFSFRLERENSLPFGQYSPPKQRAGSFGNWNLCCSDSNYPHEVFPPCRLVGTRPATWGRFIGPVFLKNL